MAEAAGGYGKSVTVHTPRFAPANRRRAWEAAPSQTSRTTPSVSAVDGVEVRLKGALVGMQREVRNCGVLRAHG